MVLRSRYTEDALQVYEVDHPDTQQLKRQQLKACGVATSASVHFVESNLAALRSIASCKAAKSELVFTYIDEAAAALALAPALKALLQGTGLLLQEDLNGHQAIARYDPAERNGLRSAGAAHMAHAVSFRSAST
ncbi:class I SAM-dependent methyltransferase [Variovorax sp. H27-G14]|uniref:class I SAM-dependent methyltransferase n=1 Tax=Variovorax sp. H27-G14 TaxID=3111914 RepID=UPI0038FC6C18